VDYKTKQATIGTKKGASVPKTEILAALEKIEYQGRFVEGRE